MAVWIPRKILTSLNVGSGDFTSGTKVDTHEFTLENNRGKTLDYVFAKLLNIFFGIDLLVIGFDEH